MTVSSAGDRTAAKTSESIAAARPRTAGEILDDAWRLYFADAPALLFLSGSFLAPAFAAVLWLMVHPSGNGLLQHLLLAGAMAALAALTGLGSGACQEFIRRRLESRPANVVACFRDALARAPLHVAIRSVVSGACLVGVLGFVPLLSGANAGPATMAAILGAGYLSLPASALWMATAPAHAVVAGREPRQGLFSEISQAARLDAGKTAVVVLSRVAVLAVALFNLYLVIAIALWVAMNLGGFDLAVASVALSVRNPVYMIALGMLCWLLLAPYFEASNYFLYLDARTRQEGLDLLHRVTRAFPSKAKAGSIILALGCLSAFTSPARCDDRWPDAVRRAKSEVEDVRAKVESAEPYPGGSQWAPQLRETGQRLDQVAANKAERRLVAWYQRSIGGFAKASRRDALRKLEEIRQRFGLIEEMSANSDSGEASDAIQRNKTDIKSLIRRREEQTEAKTPEKEEEPQKLEPRHRDIERGGPAAPVEAPSAGAGSVALPSSLSTIGAVILIGALLAVIGVAVVRFAMSRPAKQAKPPSAPTELPPANEPRPDEQPSPVLWRRAEELARSGQHRAAVRAIYLAVLSLLHAQRLLRYEPTRTNGEYVRQVRLAQDAPAGLAEPFERLTNRFEVLWYGTADASPNDFEACLRLAESARAQAQA